MSAGRLERIRPAMQRFVDQHGFAGISVMLARRGHVVHFDQIGWQDREAQTPLGPDTIFRIYSMTKPIVCAAAMTLYEEGRFLLTDPVAKYLPAFARARVLSADGGGTTHEVNPARPMLVADLFRHTAGLTYSFLEDSPASALYREANLMGDAEQSLEQMIAELARLPLAYQPGTRWHYSIAIDVIAHLIEVLSDQPLRDVLEERIFGPLGMVDTGFSVPDGERGRLSAMYGHPDVATHTFSQFVAAWQEGRNGRIDVEATNPSTSARFARGGHGLFSTAGDYMRFAQMLLNGGQLDGARVLGRKTVQFMHANHTPAALLPYEVFGIPYPGLGFGLGSRVLLDPAAAGIIGSAGEFGWSGAAKTYYWVDPQEQLIGILMSQFMMSFEQPEKYLQALAYQAIVE